MKFDIILHYYSPYDQEMILASNFTYEIGYKSYSITMMKFTN